MPETPPIVGRLLRAPAHLPEHVIQNIPEVARQYGFPDISDGVRNIGDIEIRTPEEDSICSKSYVAQLLEIREPREYLPETLAQELEIKIACGALGALEHAVMTYGFRNTAQLRKASMPLLKNNWRYALDSLKFASMHDLLSIKDTHYKKEHTRKFLWKNNLIAREPGESYSSVTARLLGIDLEEVPDLGAMPLSPATAYRRYIERYGGLPLDTTEPQIIREELKQRYEQDLEGRIFYPNPVDALARIYTGGRNFGQWRKVKQEYNPALSRKERLNQPLYCSGAGDFVLKTVGLTAAAAHQAGARLILDHIGATNLDLLQ